MKPEQRGVAAERSRVGHSHSTFAVDVTLFPEARERQGEPLPFCALVGWRRRIGRRSCPDGHRAPPAGLRRIHGGLGLRCPCWPSTIARRPTKTRRPSYGSSASLRPRRRGCILRLASDQAGNEGLGDRLRQARRRLRPGVGRNAGMARDDGGIADGVVNEISLSYARGRLSGRPFA